MGSIRHSWTRHLAVLAIAGFALFQSADTRGELPGDDLVKQLKIRRDKFGVPHILADTEEAAYFGQGYATAEDRVRVMARLYLQARGEEAEHFGEKFAEGDFLVKQLRVHEGASEGFAKLAPWVQRILDGYAAGYNRYIEKHRDTLPGWVKPATGVDLLAHGRRIVIIEFALDQEQLRAIGRRKPDEKSQTRLVDEELWLGSNMWAIGKERSASGRGILLGNPHLAWRGSQLFYESHITVPGKVNVMGSTLTGAPGITIGFNESLGWSHTVNLHDSDDIYALTFHEGNPEQYVYDGKPIPLRKETLSVKVKAENGMVTRTREVYWSHYGPVIRRIGNKAYALKSANLNEYRFVEQWNRMGKARTLQEFRDVLDMQALPMFNICYADKEGNAFYLFNGRFPERPAGYDWGGIVAGNTSATEWSRILPQHRLPSLLNPPGGYVQNCNSAPWYTNARHIIDRQQYPPELTPNINGMRQQISLEMLENHNGPFTLEQVLRMKYNTKMLLADRVKADVIEHVRGRTEDGVALDEAAYALTAWDNTASRESGGSLLFERFWRKYGAAAEKPYAEPWDERRPLTTPTGIGEPETVRRTMAATVKEMKERYGRLDVPWGEVHRLRRGNVDVAIGGLSSEFRPFRGARMGDFGTFRIINYDEDKEGKFISRGGDSFVLAVEFTSPPTAYTILAYSQSEDPNSPHHTDQTVLFADEKWKRACFTEEDIAKNLVRSYQP